MSNFEFFDDAQRCEWEELLEEKKKLEIYKAVIEYRGDINYEQFALRVTDQAERLLNMAREQTA